MARGQQDAAIGLFILKHACAMVVESLLSEPVDSATIYFSYRIFVSGSPRNLWTTRQRSGLVVAAMAIPSFRT